jgi:hypothetical protein
MIKVLTKSNMPQKAFSTTLKSSRTQETSYTWVQMLFLFKPTITKSFISRETLVTNLIPELQHLKRNKRQLSWRKTVIPKQNTKRNVCRK